MNENKLSPELQKIFDEYSMKLWRRLKECECHECNIEKATEVFRDAFADVDKIINPVRITFCKGE